jgi:hypothetical protein
VSMLFWSSMVASILRRFRVGSGVWFSYVD